MIKAGLFDEEIKLVKPDDTEYTVRAWYRSRKPIEIGLTGQITEAVGLGEFVVRHNDNTKDVNTQWTVKAFDQEYTIDSVDSGNYRPGLYIFIQCNIRKSR